MKHKLCILLLMGMAACNAERNGTDKGISQQDENVVVGELENDNIRKDESPQDENIVTAEVENNDTHKGKSQLLENYILEEIEKYYHDEYGNESRLEKSDTDTIRQLAYYSIPESEEDYAGMLIIIDIPKSTSKALYGDLNHDNEDDLMVSVYTEGGGGGGNVAWSDYFVFFKTGQRYELAMSQTSWEMAGCERSGMISIDKIENNTIIGTSLCYAETDGRCCPSLRYYTQLQIINDEIVVSDRKKLATKQ